MKETIEQKMERLLKMARESGPSESFKVRVNRSSLSKIIRTKEQAERFMNLLKLASGEYELVKKTDLKKDSSL